MAKKISNNSNNNMRQYASRFPPDVFTPSNHYIYFLSLKDHPNGEEILKYVSPYFSTPLEKTLMKGNRSIDDAFDFLDAVIASEYNKERNFLAYLQKQTKEFQNFSIPSSEEDWSLFIKDIQEALGSGERGITSMENELKRILKQNKRRGDRKNISDAYEQDQINKLTQYANMLNNFISADRKTHENSQKLSKQIYGLILSKYGAKLITEQNGKPVFNRTQLLSLMNTISSIILHDYVIKTSLDSNKEYKQFADSTEQFDISKLENIISSPEINNRIDSIIKNATALPWLSDDLSENLGLIKTMQDDTFNSQQFSALSSRLSKLNNCKSTLEQIGDDFSHLYDNYVIPESAFKITSTGNVYSEAVSAINGLARGAKGIFGTGASGAKPDSIWGFIDIDVDKLLELKTSDNNKYLKAMNKLTQIHSELKTLSHNMKSKNTLTYYEKQEDEWNNAVNHIHELIAELKANYQLLNNCYIIEDSTKNYISLYGKTINNHLSDSMHGGSLGPNIQDQIDKLHKLAEIGAVSFPNIKWLIAAIINSGPDMIAHEKKNMLEDYLAAFATILLFDDQLNIVKEAYKSQLKITPPTDVTKIHLFSVNDGYYPLSYVLRMTRQALVKNYDNAQAYIKNSPSGGAAVEISGYVKEPQEAYKDKKAENQWYATREAALSETKLHLTFLVGFLDLLQKLFPDIK